MSEKIYARLLRLYPSGFRQEYQGEALQLIRDRLRDERGFFKRARLWCDLVADVLAGLPSAYRNSYAAAEAGSFSLNPAAIPSFRTLEDEPLGRASILVGATLSLIVLAAFALLLSLPAPYRPLPGSNGKLSPIEAVMQHLNQATEPDSSTSSLQDPAPPSSAQTGALQAQLSLPASSTANGAPGSNQNQAIAIQMQNLKEHPVVVRSGPTALKAATTANVQSSGYAAHSAAQSGPISPGQPHPAAASHAIIPSIQPQDIADTWQGTLHAGKDLRTVIRITKANSGGYRAAFYSIDQSATPLPVTTLTLEGDTVRYSIKSVGLTYEGKLSADGKTIVGRSNQGASPLPLTFSRSTQETAWQLPQP